MWLAGWLAGWLAEKPGRWLRAARPAGWRAGLIEFYTCLWHGVFFEGKWWLRVCEVSWYLYLAQVFEKYADLPKTQHAVTWRKYIAYSSKKSDGVEYDTSVNTFVCIRVREIR